MGTRPLPPSRQAKPQIRGKLNIGALSKEVDSIVLFRMALALATQRRLCVCVCLCDSRCCASMCVGQCRSVGKSEGERGGGGREKGSELLI